MKAIMISIKPKWVAKILNGEKTVEIRKTMPKCDLPIDVYIYCTKDKPYLAHATELFTGKYGCVSNDEISYEEHNINGKVVAKFTLNKVSIIHDFVNGLELTEMTDRHTTIMNEEQLLKYCCLTKEELYKYGGNYAWHIGNLEIFDKPKELSEFKVRKTYVCKNCPPKYQYGVCLKDCKETLSLTKAPQNLCYVEVEENE